MTANSKECQASDFSKVLAPFETLHFDESASGQSRDIPSALSAQREE
jgi:hypothetical protein